MPAPAPDTSDCEITITRLIDAPRDLVWKAFTTPEHLIHWWGPNGFTNTFHEIDVRPGGVWRFMMHGPDGTDYPNRVRFEEIVKPERIVYLHDDDNDAEPKHVFRATATFMVEAGLPAGQAGKTRVTLRLVLESAEEREKKVKFGAIEGGNQTLGRLDAYVQKMR